MNQAVAGPENKILKNVIQEWAVKAHRGSKVELNSFFNFGARWGRMANSMQRPLYLQERDPVLIVQEARWASGPVWAGAETLVLTGTRAPHRPARSESLYRLRYPGPQRKKVRV
jgi:hypothetical protein